MDHHPLWLDALERLLEKVGITVAARTTDVDEAFGLIEQHKPDVVVTEYESLRQEDSTLPLLRHARTVRADVKCVVLAAGPDGEQIATAFANGASVVCAKTAPPDDLALAVRQAFDRSIHFAASHMPAEPRESSAKAMSAASLTKREVEILRLVSEGYSNSQLARMLWVTEQTVKFHLSNIYRKLNVSNRTEAARWAQVNNLLAPESDRIGATHEFAAA